MLKKCCKNCLYCYRVGTDRNGYDKYECHRSTPKWLGEYLNGVCDKWTEKDNVIRLYK